MDAPTFFSALPALDLPFPPDVVTTRALPAAEGLGVFFFIHQDVELPEHAHKGQWGVVISGRLDLTMNGETVSHGPGSHYDIPAGTLHGAKVYAGTVVFDVFEEPDRYPVRP